jgi:hypothetical protein
LSKAKSYSSIVCARPRSTASPFRRFGLFKRSVSVLEPYHCCPVNVLGRAGK